MLNVEFLMRYHPQFYIGCKSTIKNRDKQKKSKQIYDLLGFLYSIPALQGICMLIVTFDEFETHTGVVVRKLVMLQQLFADREHPGKHHQQKGDDGWEE